MDNFWKYYQSAFATDLNTAQRYHTEDAYYESQELLRAQQMHQQCNAFDAQLRALDHMQQTTFRDSGLASLESQILAAEQSAWDSAFN